MRLLNTITGRNKYCGPAAVSAVAGVSTDRAAALMRHKGGRRSIRGAFNHEVLGAFRYLGWDNIMTDSFRKGRRPTLARWLDGDRCRKSAYLVNVTGHYVVVRGDWFADSRQREPVHVDAAPGRRARVVKTWRLHYEPGLMDHDVLRILETEQEERRQKRAKMDQARRVAKQIGCELESLRKAYGPDSRGWNVWPPKGMLDQLDPFSGDHFADDEFEVHHRVNVYSGMMR